MQKRKSEQTSAKSATSPMNQIPNCWSRIAMGLSLGLHEGHPIKKRSLQLSKENIQNYKNMKLFHSFLFLCIIFALLDPDPPNADLNPCRLKLMQIHADPDPQHFLFYLANCLRLLGISVSMGCVILTSGYWSPPLPTRDFTSVSGFKFQIMLPIFIGFYERYVVLRHPRSMRVLPSGHLQNKYDYCITIKCFTGSPSARFSIARIFMIFTP